MKLRLVRKVEKKKEKGAAAGAVGKERVSKAKERVLRRKALVAQVMAKQEQDKNVAAYGAGLSSMSNLEKALEQVASGIALKELEEELKQVALRLGKGEMSLKQTATAENEGITLFFGRWSEFKNAQSTIFPWVKNKLESEAATHKIDLEKYKELRKSVSNWSASHQ